jgi:hypothetical protein
MLRVNNRSRKHMGLSRMDNAETLATLSTQDTGRRQSNQKTKTMSNTDPTTYIIPYHNRVIENTEVQRIHPIFFD